MCSPGLRLPFKIIFLLTCLSAGSDPHFGRGSACPEVSSHRRWCSPQALCSVVLQSHENPRSPSQILQSSFLKYLCFSDLPFVSVAPALGMLPARALAQVTPRSLFRAACHMKFLYCPGHPEHRTLHRFLWQSFSVLLGCYFSHPSPTLQRRSGSLDSS